jgi:hypothetical protein
MALMYEWVNTSGMSRRSWGINGSGVPCGTLAADCPRPTWSPDRAA